MTDSCPHATTPGTEGKPVVVKRKLQEGPFKDLARAIIKFGEVYERIESAKQQQLIDLEKQRMEFTKDLELQRMQLFMQTQVELAKMKHGKHGSTGENSPPLFVFSRQSSFPVLFRVPPAFETAIVLPF